MRFAIEARPAKYFAGRVCVEGIIRGMTTPTTAKQALVTTRIIWAAMLAGEVMFLVVILKVVLPGRTEPPHVQPLFTLIGAVMLASMVPMAFVARGIVFRRGRVSDGGGGEDRIAPAAYATGNIIFWAACEGVAFFGLVTAVLNGTLWPSIVITAIAMGLQAGTFPFGGRLAT